jgi:myo-inositol-1(or 4)-monophosphatase
MTNSSFDLTEALPFTEHLAREAGALLMRYAREGFEVTHKGAIDLVTTADHESEQLIVSAIRRQYPDHGVMSEEDAARPDRFPHPELVEGRKPVRSNRFVWIVDPIDGTTDFVHDYPAFAVSIALYEDATPLVGVIYDPVRDELFSARQGSAATLNGRPIHVSRTDQLIKSLLTSGFPYDVQETGRNVDTYLAVMNLTQAVRISGAAALDMAWVACGRIDGYWEPEIKPWDVAAGALIVRQAGGRVSDYANADWQPATRQVVATNARLHELLLSQLE